nr:uncharacterized protein LOC110365618 isoform X1 [Columba livia]XP_021155770.1 uncharacterized protein LOC110365618 isoform X2 [Columba livia]
MLKGTEMAGNSAQVGEDRGTLANWVSLEIAAELQAAVQGFTPRERRAGPAAPALGSKERAEAFLVQPPENWAMEEAAVGVGKCMGVTSVIDVLCNPGEVTEHLMTTIIISWLHLPALIGMLFHPPSPAPSPLLQKTLCPPSAWSHQLTRCPIPPAEVRAPPALPAEDCQRCLAVPEGLKNLCFKSILSGEKKPNLPAQLQADPAEGTRQREIFHDRGELLA